MALSRRHRATKKARSHGVLAALAVLVIAAICVRLGFWQLSRLEQRRAFVAAVSAAMALPPLELTGEMAAILDPATHLYRRVTVLGVYGTEGEVLLRGRAHGGRPGVHLVAPLRVSDSAAIILVNRGWLPSPDAATADPRPYRRDGPQRVEGILQSIPAADAETLPLAIDLGDTSVTSLRRLDHGVLSTALATSLPQLYIQEVPFGRPPGELPIPLPPPALDDGPHLGYALQWFSFAVIALTGLGVLIYRGERGR